MKTTPTTAERIARELAMDSAHIPIIAGVIDKELERERQQVRTLIISAAAQLHGTISHEGKNQAIATLHAALAMLEPSRDDK